MKPCVLPLCFRSERNDTLLLGVWLWGCWNPCYFCGCPQGRWQNQMQQLRDMGIQDEELMLRALQATDGDIQAALELIFAGRPGLWLQGGPERGAQPWKHSHSSVKRTTPVGIWWLCYPSLCSHKRAPLVFWTWWQFFLLHFWFVFNLE